VVLVGLASGEESDPEESITGAVLGAYSIKEEIKIQIHVVTAYCYIITYTKRLFGTKKNLES
jgi:hypothetical protein